MVIFCAGSATLPIAATKSGCGEADAEEVRARGALPPLTTTALPLRRLHVADQVSTLHVYIRSPSQLRGEHSRPQGRVRALWMLFLLQNYCRDFGRRARKALCCSCSSRVIECDTLIIESFSQRA